MFDRQFSSVSMADVQRLIENSVAEGPQLEYKQELKVNQDKEKKEFLADVSAFANSSGGVILYGVAVDPVEKGIPVSIPGLAIYEHDQTIRKLEQLIQDGVAPRLQGIDFRKIDVDGGGPVLAIRIPKSWLGPHMVMLGGTSRFFIRKNSLKSQLNVDEIRSAFLESDAKYDRAKRFRDDRLGQILVGETPAPLDGSANPITVVHMIPISSVGSDNRVNFGSGERSDFQLWPPRLSGGTSRRNFDGFVTIVQSNEDRGRSPGYVQVFRTGAIEAVSKQMIGLNDHHGMHIPSKAFELNVVDAARTYFNWLKNHEVECPIAICLSILGIKGAYMTSGFGPGERCTIEKDNLIFPEVIVESLETPPEVWLKPVFDIL